MVSCVFTRTGFVAGFAAGADVPDAAGSINKGCISMGDKAGDEAQNIRGDYIMCIILCHPNAIKSCPNIAA